MGISQALRVGADAPVCPAERSSASGTYQPAKGVGIGPKTDMTSRKLEAALSKPAAAGLAPGRPDEGVWAYVCIAKLRTPKKSFSAAFSGVGATAPPDLDSSVKVQLVKAGDPIRRDSKLEVRSPKLVARSSQPRAF